MQPVHIAEFPPTHICFQRRPSCALFPLEAHRLRFALKQVWMVRQRPLDPISMGMDICIMPQGTSTVAVMATVKELAVCGAGWVVFKMCPTRLSVDPFLLCVPTVWVILPEGAYVPTQLTIKEQFRFYRLSGVLPRILDIALRTLYLPPGEQSNSSHPNTHPRSSMAGAATSTIQLPAIVISPRMSHHTETFSILTKSDLTRTASDNEEDHETIHG